MKPKSAILSAATLLAAIVLNPAGAMAETVGTGCLAKLGGEIYNLAPYRSAPSNNCRTGDQKIRLSFHQPNTAFAKRSQFSNEQGPLSDRFWPGAIAVFDTDFVIEFYGATGVPTLPYENCTLAASDLAGDFAYVFASVPPGSVQEGLGTVTVIYVPEDDVFVPPYQTRRTLFTDRGALVFHDLIVDNRGPHCFVAFFVEYAADPRQLYDR